MKSQENALLKKSLMTFSFYPLYSALCVKLQLASIKIAIYVKFFAIVLGETIHNFSHI